MQAYDAIIVGGGHGGAQAAIALRQNGFTGSILIVSREAELPYERPPLSKDYLAGEKPFERLLIRRPSFWEDKAVELLLGQEVVAVDADAHAVTLSDGSRRGYSHLVWAAGGDPRKLACEGAELEGLFSIRTKSDVDGLKAAVAGGTRKIVVIGGGYIGLEAAAVLTRAGHAVTLLEAQPRVLARVAGPQISSFYESEHRGFGVDLRTNVRFDRLVGANGHVTGVQLADGTVVPADLVIVGIGIIPSVEPLLAAGAKGGNGVDVDACCRTSLPDIYAIGDCACHSAAYADGAHMRVESVQNANDMATAAARTIMGKGEPYHALPWFWSNQYDLKLQTVGLSLGHDATVLRGDPADRSFSVIYLRDGKVIALDCVNAMKDYVQGRKLVEAAAAIAPDMLADVTRPLKALLEPV